MPRLHQLDTGKDKWRKGRWRCESWRLPRNNRCLAWVFSMLANFHGQHRWHPNRRQRVSVESKM